MNIWTERPSRLGRERKILKNGCTMNVNSVPAANSTKASASKAELIVTAWRTRQKHQTITQEIKERVERIKKHKFWRKAISTIRPTSHDRHYGIKGSRSGDFMIINIESDARRRVEKEAFLARLSDKLAASPGIARDDVFVRLSVTGGAEDWSFGSGVPASRMIVDAS